jgi:hypothetical protein
MGVRVTSCESEVPSLLPQKAKIDVVLALVHMLTPK